MLFSLPQGFKERYAPVLGLACALIACAAATSCSSPTSARVIQNEVPATVTLAVSGTLSQARNVGIEVGKTQAFTASAANSAGTALAETFSYQSSAPGVVTISTAGLACAGTWDSLITPTVCTPGSTGTAQITATANGVTSPPVTIYVHQHVTSVVIQKVPNQPPTLSPNCLSKGAPAGPEQVMYQASAFAGSADITGSVGPFSFQATNVAGQGSGASVVSLQTFIVPQQFNLVTATASAPGATSIFASVGSVNSQPLTFVTCPVQSISLSINGSAVGTAPFLISSTLSVNATAIDSAGMVITNVPLTWSSTNPLTVSAAFTGASGFASAAIIGSPGVGAATVTASCTPPACNGGISPSLPVYANNSVSVIAHGSTSSSSPSAFVTTTGCSATTQSCTTRVVPITRSGTAPFAAGAPVNLPSTPNSFVFGPTASSVGYLGVQSQGFGTQGLMTFSGTSASQFNGTAGRVLAVSPDGLTAILSDTSDSPSRVIICKSCSTASPTMVPILFPPATAAAFSVEGSVGAFSGFKAYIVSGGSCPGTSSAGCLLVYSTVDAPKVVPLLAPATSAAFIGQGAVGFLAGGDPAGMTFLPTCDVPPASSGLLGTVPAAAQLLLPLPDGHSVLTLAPPDIQTIDTTLTGSGCPSPRGSLTVTATPGPSMNLGEGTFTPTQFFLSPDGTKGYILGTTTGGAPIPFIISFNLSNSTTSLISLTGNAIPLNAGISPNGDVLFVGANDGQVHIVDPSTGFDTQQVALPFPLNSLCVGPGNPATQVPLSSLTISAASFSSPTITYTYSLTTGAPLSVGETIVVSGMADPANNGTFTISALGPGTFSVASNSGTSASAQNGTATVPLPCNPDLVAVKP